MASNGDNLRDRLQDAALALFGECGYERTTAAQIAARAGVTERTFFRHFPDKREVLFQGEAVLRDALTGAIADAPDGLSALGLSFRAFRSVVPLLEANRSFAAPRQAVIAANPALAERELAKLAALANALAAALEAHGIERLPAVLAARSAMAAFTEAAVAWLDDPTIGLRDRLDHALDTLKMMLREDP